MIPFAPVALAGAVVLSSTKHGLLAAAQSTEEAAAPCTVCSDGKAVSLPDKEIDVPFFGLEPCSKVEESVISYGLAPGSDFCNVVQSLGSVCGCSVSAQACTLCHDGSSVEFPSRLLGGLFLSEFFEVIPTDGDPISCEILEAVLHSKERESNVCLNYQKEFSELCGCLPPPPPDVGDEEKQQNETDILVPPTSPPENLAKTPPKGQQCTVCRNGEEIGLPNQTLALDIIPVERCVGLDRFASSLSPGSLGCSGAQALGTHCGCPVPGNACTLCPDGSRVKYPDRKLDWFTNEEINQVDFPDYLQSFAKNLTCGLLESALHSLAGQKSIAGIHMETACIALQLQASLCGCDTYWKDIVLFWSYRVSGMLSLLGSSLILYDVLSTAKKRGNTYHQLIAGMSSFDIVSSLAYILAGIVLPASSGYYSAVGNEATCSMQAFMIQLGQTSVFYNMALSTYYLFVIKYNWKEFVFQRYRRYMHGLLLAVGLGMASGGLPFYGQQLAICKVTLPPNAKNQIPNTFFVTIPIVSTLFVLASTSVVVCWTVYRQEKKALRWSLNRERLEMTKKVVWQSLFFVASFWFTLSFQFISNYIKYTKKNHYWVMVVKGVALPLQGFLNALVYTYRAKGSQCFSPCGCICGMFRLCFTRRKLKEEEGGNNQEGGSEPNRKTPSTNTESTRNVASTADRASGHDGEEPTMQWGSETDGAAEPEATDAEVGSHPHEAAERIGATDLSNSETSDGSSSDMFCAAEELWLLSQEEVKLPSFRGRIVGFRGSIAAVRRRSRRMDQSFRRVRSMANLGNIPDSE